MGWQERDYHRDDSGAGRGLSTAALRGRSVVFWLITINVGVFLLDKILISGGMGSQLVFTNLEGKPVSLGLMGPLELWGHFSGYFAIQNYQAWRFLSFQFLHANFGHILFNMLGLFFFGPMVEHYLGSRRFLIFYLICGAIGSLAYLFFWAVGLILAGPLVPLIGASAGVLGVLVGAAVIAPNTTVQLLFPPIPVRLKTLAWVIVGIGVFTILFRGFQRGSNAGGEAAHLGGCLAGYLLIRYAHVLSFVDRFSSNQGRRAVGGSSKKRNADPAEIDRILDKVREQGIQSLSRKERKTLQSETDRQRSGGVN
ncbi:MAG: rhomboid family intramembrane serine protease [Planctomycetota bacterium]